MYKIMYNEIGRCGVAHRPSCYADYGTCTLASSALLSAVSLARAQFSGKRVQPLFAGMATHSVLSLEAPASAAVSLTLMAPLSRLLWRSLRVWVRSQARSLSWRHHRLHLSRWGSPLNYMAALACHYDFGRKIECRSKKEGKKLVGEWRARPTKTPRRYARWTRNWSQKRLPRQIALGQIRSDRPYLST